MSAGGSSAPRDGETTPSSSGEAAGSGPARSHRSVTDLELAFAANPRSDAYVELCEAYLEKRRFMEALVVCKRAASLQPEAVAPHLLLSRVHEAQGRLPKAREVLEQLKRPDDPAVLTALGRIELAQGDNQGIERLKRALELDPAQTEASRLLEARGILHPLPPPPPEPPPVGVGPPPVPVEVAAPYLSATPGMPWPGAGESGVYRLPPQRLEGEEELERIALAVAEERPRPGRPGPTLALGAALLIATAAVVGVRLTAKARAEAIDSLSKEAVQAFDRDLYGAYQVSASKLEEIVEKHDASHARTWARLAHVQAILLTEHLDLGRRARLEQALLEAERLAPDDPHTIAARGLHTLAGTEADAAKRAAAALLPHAGASSVPTFADLTLGIAELEMGDVEAARSRLLRVAEVMGSNTRARIWAARAAARAGRFSGAEQAFDAVRRSNSRHPAAIAGVALVALARGHLPKAEAALADFDQLEREGSKDISPKDRALATFAKSELLRRDGRDAAAEAEYERAVQLDPKNADLPFQRGRGLVAQERPKDAVAPLSRAVEMEPERWTFRIELAEALMLSERNEEAKEHIEAALAKVPGELEVALAQGRYLRRTKSPSAEAYLTETLATRFPLATVELGLELGRLFRSQGELDKADAALTDAITAFEPKPPALQAEVLVTYGLVSADAGRRPKALTAYRAAAKRGSLEALALLANELQNGTAEERQEALEAAQRYLAAGKGLRRTGFVKKIAIRLGG